MWYRCVMYKMVLDYVKSRASFSFMWMLAVGLDRLLVQCGRERGPRPVLGRDLHIFFSDQGGLQLGRATDIKVEFRHSNEEFVVLG